MAIELTRVRTLSKPWGVVDLRPWSNGRDDGGAIGEIWYERSGEADTVPSLLLKLIFTNKPLSIQVHPDDKFARSMGLPNGKTEAWYVLSAIPEAKIALGLHRRMTPQEIRKSVDDGSICDLVEWRSVTTSDVILVPAGTIHAIGAGIVIAEIQQRSDATFRLFDHGRKRELHVDDAIAAANAGPADPRVQPSRLTNERTLLATSPHFVFERIDLEPDSAWSLDGNRETWLLVISGNVHAGPFEIGKGDAIFAQLDRVDMRVGKTGMVGLVAYVGGKPILDLLRRLGQPSTTEQRQDVDVQSSQLHSFEEVGTLETAWKPLP